MRADIRPYTDEHWEGFRQLILNQWPAGHALMDRDLFAWQYRGYGPLLEGESCSRVLFVKDRLVGFLGGIPGLYQVPGVPEPVPGIALALWLVHRDYRNAGLGLLLLAEAEEIASVITCLGANRHSVRYLSARGFDHIPALNRYVLPLEAEGYRRLLGDSAPVGDIRAWADRVRFEEGVEPVALDPSTVASTWFGGVGSCSILGLHREKAFWQWRYGESKGFEYLFFGSKEIGFAVSRVETVLAEGDDRRSGMEVLRLIEFVPPGAGPWDREPEEHTLRLLRGVLGWARRQGCAAADFQCTSRRLEPLLSAAGFRAQNAEYGPAICSLAGLFNPLEFNPRPINALLRVRPPVARTIDADDTYLLKSDGDMDRPRAMPPR